MDMSANSPFVAQLNSKDERFIHKATPRSLGGSSARWNPDNYKPVHVVSSSGLSGNSPFKEKRQLDQKHFTRKGASGWRSKDYKVIKATGAKGLSKEESPFYAKPEDIDPEHFLHKGKHNWKEKDYKNFKLSQGVTIKHKNPLSKKELKDTPRGRFGGLRNDRAWTEQAYRDFKLVQDVEEVSPFQSMKEECTPRSRVRNQYQRNGRVGDFGLPAAQKSFLENQAEAKRIQMATNGHGGGGAGEAIFGGKYQPGGAPPKRKLKGATIFVDGKPQKNAH